jgi:hypothetical protein
VARPTNECRIALDPQHDSGDSESLTDEGPEDESIWGVYARPEWTSTALRKLVTWMSSVLV